MASVKSIGLVNNYYNGRSNNRKTTGFLQREMKGEVALFPGPLAVCRAPTWDSQPGAFQADTDCCEGFDYRDQTQKTAGTLCNTEGGMRGAHFSSSSSRHISAQALPFRDNIIFCSSIKPTATNCYATYSLVARLIISLSTLIPWPHLQHRSRRPFWVTIGSSRRRLESVSHQYA